MSNNKREPKKAKLQMRTSQQVKVRSVSESKLDYSLFDKIDGSHPWMKKMPEGYLAYSARVLPEGKVGYFNFKLAKEMGLIPKSHPEKFNKKLEKKLLETFCLQVINEYDIQHRRRFPKETIKPNKYMATRYLQLQHADKTGKTSGDGRSIWNGSVQNNGKTWDISSRGTGVTALAPGVVEAGKPLKSGSEEFGYGCGMAEVDELYSTAILSEIFYNQGIQTERMLAIIDLGKGLGIGVRAGENLIRPAHIFSYLKQGEQDSLVRSLDYLIDRQYKNNDWSFSTKHPRKYSLMLDEICNSFAHLAANLDVDYIFTWLDWDGDNVLANAGIIDYGSIRQFGLRYDQYRYDDVERFSTTLNEQKNKAQLIVQVFAQAVDFAQNGKKQSFELFKNHHSVENFQKKFEEHRLRRVLYRVGFDQNNTNHLMADHRKTVNAFVAEYDFLERKKSSEPIKEVADGVNRPALFNIRKLLRELPRFLATEKNFEKAVMDEKIFFTALFAECTPEEEQKINSNLKKRALLFQNLYKELIRSSKRRRGLQRVLTDIAVRSEKINRSSRMTGNGIIQVVSKLLKAKKLGLSNQGTHSIIQKLIHSQVFDPDISIPKFESQEDSKPKKIFQSMLELIEEHEEDL